MNLFILSDKHELSSVAALLRAGQVEETGKILVYYMTGSQSKSEYLCHMV